MEDKNKLNFEAGRESGFEELAKEGKKVSWMEHLKKARDLLRQKSTGEKVESKYYRLTGNAKVYGKTRKDRKFWENIYKNWDEIGVEIPMELGKMVEEYVNNPDYQFGVHHSYMVKGANYEQDSALNSILKEGLTNWGDASSGAFYKDPPVSKTVSFCPNMFHAVMQIKGSYKGSTGAVLVAIPSKYVDFNGKIKEGMVNEVYNHNENGYSTLKPEFILGFAKNLGKGSVVEYKSREELLKGYVGPDTDNN
jgi:hypothetical protein